MGRWKHLGESIGAHMPGIVLACVALGVLFPRTFSPVEAIVPALFAIMTFQGALSNTLQNVLDVFRHPLPLIGILGITLVFMPTLAFGLASVIFAGSTDIITGILLEYSVPIGVVSFMWVGMFAGNASLALAAILVSTVIAPFSIPLTLKLFMGATIHVDVAGMIVNMIFMIALPALAGMALNDLTRGWGAHTLSPAMSPACKILLLVIITANSTEMSNAILHLTWERVGVGLFIFLFAGSGFIWGILVARLLRLPSADMVTMGFDCGLRNISSGAVIATQYFPGEAVFPVMCGTIFQQLLASIAGRLMQRIQEDRDSR